MASLMEYSSPDRAIWVRVFAGKIVVVFLGKNFSPHPVYWRIYCWGALGVTLRWTSIRGRRNTHLVASCFRNWDKLRPDGPISLYVDRFLLPSLIS